MILEGLVVYAGAAYYCTLNLPCVALDQPLGPAGPLALSRQYSPLRSLSCWYICIRLRELVNISQVFCLGRGGSANGVQ